MFFKQRKKEKRKPVTTEEITKDMLEKIRISTEEKILKFNDKIEKKFSLKEKIENVLDMDGQEKTHMIDRGYKKGEFCKYIGCMYIQNLLNGDKRYCINCGAYMFHDYIQQNFEPLKRK